MITMISVNVWSALVGGGGVNPGVLLIIGLSLHQTHFVSADYYSVFSSNGKSPGLNSYNFGSYDSSSFDSNSFDSFGNTYKTNTTNDWPTPFIIFFFVIILMMFITCMKWCCRSVCPEEPNRPLTGVVVAAPVITPPNTARTGRAGNTRSTPRTMPYIISSHVLSTPVPPKPATPSSLYDPPPEYQAPPPYFETIQQAQPEVSRNQPRVHGQGRY